MTIEREVIHMARKRLTQMFPFLLPLRRWQRKKCFYWKMWWDRNKYAKERQKEHLPCEVYRTSSLMLNENSGFDMKYQYNKVHNLKLAAKTIDGLLIAPGETFSFWQLVRRADRREPYRNGLILVNGRIEASYGGGLCQVSNMLFWMFLHTPLTIVERHGHRVESFPSTDEDQPCGTDATVNEGWLDLKVKNDTDQTFQILITFDEEYMYGEICSDREWPVSYEIFNRNVRYVKRDGKVYQTALVCRIREDAVRHTRQEEELYQNRCEIGYTLPPDIYIEEIPEPAAGGKLLERGSEAL